MNFLIVGTPYPSFECCTLVDGLQWLGHNAYGFSGDSNNYLVPHNGEPVDVVIHCYTDAGDFNLYSDKIKILLWGHDRWTDYASAPNSPIKRMDMSKFTFDLCFYRDKDTTITDPRVHPYSFGIERRYQEACAPHLLKERSNAVVFFGTLTTANRRHYLDKLSQNGIVVKYGAYEFNEPDNKWSKWIKGRYTHDPRYYEEICKYKFMYCGFGAGPSCGRTYEAYAAGCIPVMQKFPDSVIPLHEQVDGVNCILWETESELVDKMRYYVSNESKAEELRIKCYDYGQEYLLTKHVAEFLLDKVQELFLDFSGEFKTIRQR